MTNRPSDEYKIADAGAIVAGDLAPIDRHPGIYLREVILPEYGMTNVADLARRLDVQRVGLVQILQGRRAISREMAYRFGALLNDHVAEFLIAYQARWDLEQEKDLRQQLRASIKRLPEPSTA